MGVQKRYIGILRVEPWSDSANADLMAQHILFQPCVLMPEGPAAPSKYLAAERIKSVSMQ